MRSDPLPVEFTAVRPDHYPLLRQWLNAPHMQEWWGDPETELGFIRDMVEGHDTTRPFLILVDGEPVGYIQYWFVGHHQNEQWVKDNPWLMELPSETIGVDLSIGDPQKLSRGIGSAALTAFVRLLRDNGHTHIIIDPDPDNRRAVCAYARAGFRPVPHLEGRTEGVLIMRHHTTVNELT